MLIDVNQSVVVFQSLVVKFIKSCHAMCLYKVITRQIARWSTKPIAAKETYLIDNNYFILSTYENIISC